MMKSCPGPASKKNDRGNARKDAKKKCFPGGRFRGKSGRGGFLTGFHQHFVNTNNVMSLENRAPSGAEPELTVNLPPCRGKVKSETRKLFPFLQVFAWCRQGGERLQRRSAGLTLRHGQRFHSSGLQTAMLKSSCIVLYAHTAKIHPIDF